MGLFLCDLGSDRLSWRLLAGIVRHSPRDSALMRVTFGAEVAWSSTEHLLAALVDLTQYLVWFKTEDARSGRNRPKPIHRPGMDEAHGDVSLGSGGMVIDPNDSRSPAEQVRARYEQLATEQAVREEAVPDGV